MLWLIRWVICSLFVILVIWFCMIVGEILWIDSVNLSLLVIVLVMNDSCGDCDMIFMKFVVFWGGVVI